MLYRTCKRMIEKGNTAGMATKLDVFYAANKLTEDVTYIKKADNGCYILCPEPDASGISYAGTPYHLFGRKPLDDAESVILEPTDIGGWIMGAKAAIEDADEMNVDQAYRLTLLELNVSDTDDTENT